MAETKGATIGYARVSTIAQAEHGTSLEYQRERLIAAGCDPERIFWDKATGKNTERPGLQELLNWAREGDTVKVCAMGRLGRSVKDVIAISEKLSQRGVELVFLDENIDMSGPAGRLMFHIFAALAEFEREMILERTAAGRAKAAAEGRLVGRPVAFSEEVAAEAARLRAEGKSVREVCSAIGISKGTFYNLRDRYPQVL